MSAECYQVCVPDGRRLTGLTVAGQRVPILPGEYHVHRLPPKAGVPGETTLRFVGAHGGENDVHIRLHEGADLCATLAVEVQAVKAL